MSFCLFLIIAMCNFGLSAVLYVAAKRMALAGASAISVTATMSAWALSYMVVSWIVGRVLKEKNASRIMRAGGILGTIASFGSLILTQNTMLYVWVFLLGISCGMYCAPAQVLVKRVSAAGHDGGILKAAGKYTVSWSIGTAVGTLLTGTVWQLMPDSGWMFPFVILGLTFFGMFIWARIIDRYSPPPEDHSVPEPDPAYRNFPDLVPAGWLLGGCGIFIVSLLRAYLPYKTTDVGMLTVWEGIIISLISFTQAAAAFLLGNFGKYWMYRICRLGFLCCCGIGSLLLFSFGTSEWVLCAAAVLFGLFSGMFYVYFVFMAMFSPVRSAKNCSINECIVGIVSCFGPLAGGWIALGGRDLPFMVMSVLLLLAAVVSLVYTAKKVPRDLLS